MNALLISPYVYADDRIAEIRMQSCESNGVSDPFHDLLILLHDTARLEYQRTSELTLFDISMAEKRGKKHGRPASMTMARTKVAIDMLQKECPARIILPVLSAMAGPKIGRAAYYNWQKTWKSSQSH